MLSVPLLKRTMESLQEWGDTPGGFVPGVAGEAQEKGSSIVVHHKDSPLFLAL